MAFTVRVKCVMLLVSLIFNGYEFAELQVEKQQLTSNGDWVQGRENANKQNGENIDKPLDLASIFGNDWESENRPLEKEKLESILKSIFGSKDAKEIESSTRSNLKPNDITFGSLINTQRENKQFSETDIDQNTEAPWKDSQEAPRGDNDYESTFNAQTAFPFEVFNGQFKPDGQGGVIPVSSSYRPETKSTSSPDATASSFRPKPQIDVYATTTPSYWYGSQGKFHPTTTSATFAGVVNRTDASITASADDPVTSTTPMVLPESHTEEKPDIPSSTPSHVNPTGPSFYPAKQSEIEISSTVPSAINPIKPNYWPEVPIRPNFGYGFGYHSGNHNFGTHYWPSSYSGGFRPHGYQYHRHNAQFYLPNGPRHNFQYRYNSNLPHWSNRQSDYGKNIDIRFGGGANVNQYHGEWARPNPIRMPMSHNHRHRHHHYPGFHSHHGGTFIRYR